MAKTPKTYAPGLKSAAKHHENAIRNDNRRLLAELERAISSARKKVADRHKQYRAALAALGIKSAAQAKKAGVRWNMNAGVSVTRIVSEARFK